MSRKSTVSARLLLLFSDEPFIRHHVADADAKAVRPDEAGAQLRKPVHGASCHGGAIVAGEDVEQASLIARAQCHLAQAAGQQLAVAEANKPTGM